MGLEEDPKKFAMRVDCVARELRRVGKAIDEDDIPTNLMMRGGICCHSIAPVVCKRRAG